MAGWRRGRLAPAAAVASAVLLVLTSSPAIAATITSAGRLTNVTITPDLNCAVNHISDSAPEFFGSTACATLVATGGILYGPAAIPAGESAAPRTTFTAVSQSPVTGAGTSANPFTIVTVVDLGTSGLRLTQTDRYIVGQESYRTDVRLDNTGPTPVDAIVYRVGDCFLQSSDSGYGVVGSPAGAIACTTMPPPNTGGRIEQWYPITPGSHYLHDFYATVWATVGAQVPFPDTCACTTFLDNGAGLSWNVTVPAGGSVTVSNITTFSPTGEAPLAVTKTADSPTAAVAGADGYTIVVNNPNSGGVTVNSISDTLPAGFIYTPGSTTGVTSSNPTVSGQTLTWNGPFAVPGSGSVTLHFGVTVSSTTGTFRNSASADAGAVTVASADATAPITVTRAQPTITTAATSSSITATTNPPVSDTATLANGVAPTGTLTFTAYGPNDTGCTGPIAFTGTATVSGNGAYTSGPFAAPALGTYQWVVSYDGNAGNFPASSPCGAPNETSTVRTICSAVPAPGPNAILTQPGVITIGTPGDDVIYGTPGNDRIHGFGGNDTVFGGGGIDEITGGEGHDTLCGGTGNDRITGAEGNDLLSGDDGNDDLTGSTGNDRLFGGPDNDRLVGAEGTDTCAGGGQPGDLYAPAPNCDMIV
jgi:uncharacterized repeat protein (TIGR01451 family)